MKAVFAGALISIIAVTATGCRERSAVAQVKSDGDQVEAKAPVGMGPVWHIVAFRFKDDAATHEAVHTKARDADGNPIGIIEAFKDLQRTVFDPEDPTRRLIMSFNYGMNNSTEQVTFGPAGTPRDRTLEITFVATFKNCKDRDYYVDLAPTHQAFKALVGPLLAQDPLGAFVTDFYNGVTLPRTAGGKRTDDCRDIVD